MHIYEEFVSTPSTLWVDLRQRVLRSTDWSNPAGTILTTAASNGAQIVIEITGGGSATRDGIRPSFWRSYTAGVLADRLNRSLYWSRATDSSLTVNSPIWVRVAAGTNLFYLDIEGPRAGEVGQTAGSVRQYLFASPVTPYFSLDNPSVAVGGSIAPSEDLLTSRYSQVHISTSRNGDRSWVEGKIFTLTTPGYHSGQMNHTKWQPYAAGDGYAYLFPWVVMEDLDGIRGRLGDLFYGGVDRMQTDTVAGWQAGQVFGYRGATYKLLRPIRNDGVRDQGGSFGYYAAAGGVDQSPLVAVRTTHQDHTWSEVERFTWDEMAAMV